MWTRNSNNRLIREQDDTWNYESIEYDTNENEYKLSDVSPKYVNLSNDIKLIEGAKLSIDEGFYLIGKTLKGNRYKYMLYNIKNGYIYDYNEWITKKELIKLGEIEMDLHNMKIYIYIDNENTYIRLNEKYNEIIEKSLDNVYGTGWDIIDDL